MVSGRMSNHNPVPTRTRSIEPVPNLCPTCAQREQATCQSQRRTFSLSLSSLRPPTHAF